MKQFFAKWIPVEEEIQEGDMCISNSSGVIMKAEKDFLHILNGTWDSGNKTASKVKLFLCSRDIKVGERYSMMDGDGVIGSCVATEKDIDTPIMKKHAYKVVGEISGDANWAKDGDEFDEYEEWWFNTF